MMKNRETQLDQQSPQARYNQLNQLLAKSHSTLFNFLINKIPVNIFLVDEYGYLAWGNDRMLKTLGIEKLSDFVGMHLNTWGEERWLLFKRIMDTRQEEVVEETWKDFYYLTTRTPLIDEETDNVIGVLGVSLDVSDRKKADMAKDTFIGNMSHDFRTPFGGVVGLTEMLFNEETNPDKKLYLSYILESAQSLLKMLNQILEISKLDSYPVQFSEFNIAAEVEEIVKLVHAELKLKNLSLTVDCLEGLVFNDKLRISRILLSLITNAVKFTKQGQINVKVFIDQDLVISVKDTGIGISEENKEIIFDKFSKLKPSDKTGDFQGTGTGLFIAKQFATELKGSLDFQSRADEGAVFICRLPLLRIIAS